MSNQESFLVLEGDDLNEYIDIKEDNDINKATYCEVEDSETLLKNETHQHQGQGETPGPKVAVLIPGLDGEILGGDEVEAGKDELELVEIVPTSSHVLLDEGKQQCLELVPVVQDVDVCPSDESVVNLFDDTDNIYERVTALRTTMTELKAELDKVKQSVRIESQKYPELGMYEDMTSACTGDVDAIADRNSRYETALAEVRLSAQKTRETNMRAQLYMNKVKQVEMMCEAEYSMLEKTTERVNELNKSVTDWSTSGGKYTWNNTGAGEESALAGSRCIDDPASGFSVSYRKPSLEPGSMGRMLALPDSSSLSLAPTSSMDLGMSGYSINHTPRSNDLMAEFNAQEMNMSDINVADDFKQKIKKLSAELSDTSPRKFYADRKLSELAYNTHYDF